MKHTILSVLALLSVCTVCAQTHFEAHASVSEASDLPVSHTERSEWLAPFSAVEIDAAADVLFVRVPDTQAPRIVYDTHGDSTTRFRADMRGATLRIRERSDMHRRERTLVTVYYNSLEALRMTDATVRFEGPLSAKLFDLAVGARANFEAEIDVQDLMMELSGDSRATLRGKARYLTLYASTGEANAAELKSVAARVIAKTKAKVRVDASERLEARATGGASVSYKSAPALLRFSQSTPWFASEDKEK